MQEQVRDAPRSSETLRAYSIYALCPFSELTIYMLSMLSMLYIDLCHLCYTFFVFVFRDQGTNDSKETRKSNVIRSGEYRVGVRTIYICTGKSNMKKKERGNAILKK